MRFQALESWRGICAVLVILYHFQPESHLAATGFFVNAYLFVDFFFALSGFIIFQCYFSRLSSGFPLDKFIALRFGRIYPMHFFTLALLAVYLMLRGALAPDDGTLPPPVLTGLNDNGSLLSQLFLLNAMGLHEGLSWNQPAWSIGAEFFTYIAFALAILLFGRRTALFAVGVIVGSVPALMLGGDGTINLTYELGFLRCLYGFAVGALLSLLRPDAGYFSGLSRRSVTVAEVLILGLIIFFVFYAGNNAFSILAPFVFGAAVAVFSEDRGHIAQAMCHRRLLWLGQRSYSIYMLQFICIVVGADLLWLLDQGTGTATWAMLGLVPSVAGSPWFGDLATVMLIGMVIGASAATHHFIEFPARTWVRKATGAMPAIRLLRRGPPLVAKLGNIARSKV